MKGEAILVFMISSGGPSKMEYFATKLFMLDVYANFGYISAYLSLSIHIFIGNRPSSFCINDLPKLTPQHWSGIPGLRIHVQVLIWKFSSLNKISIGTTLGQSQ